MATVDIVIPVLNEEYSLPRCLERLMEFLQNNLKYDWRITIADNGSTDRTFEIANKYQQASPERIGVIHLTQRGRGRALKKAWMESDAQVVSYMDVDLSTDLESFPTLIEAIVDEKNQIAWGSRLSMESMTKRSFKRELISRSYNILIRMIMRTHFKDAQCGFKALSCHTARAIIPKIKDNEWFFDTELLIVAEKNGLKGKEIPVGWTEDPDSRVKVFRTALQDIKGLMRLRFGGIPNVFPSD